MSAPYKTGEESVSTRSDTEADPLLRECTSGLWEELIKRIERDRNAITAGKNLISIPRTMPAAPLRE